MGTTVLQRSIYVSYYINVYVLSLMLVLYALAIHAQRGNQREKLMFNDFRKFYFFKYIALISHFSINIDFFGRRIQKFLNINLEILEINI